MRFYPLLTWVTFSKARSFSVSAQSSLRVKSDDFNFSEMPSSSPTPEPERFQDSFTTQVEGKNKPIQQFRLIHGKKRKHTAPDKILQARSQGSKDYADMWDPTYNSHSRLTDSGLNDAERFDEKWKPVKMNRKKNSRKWFSPGKVERLNLNERQG